VETKKLKTLNNIYISRENILNNFDIFQKLHPEWDIFPVLKSNAYGHGIREIANILKERKIKYIAVDSYFEALKIWEVSNVKILIIGYSMLENLSKMNFKKTSLVVYDLGTLEELARI
jgi:alanine racemase